MLVKYSFAYREINESGVSIVISIKSTVQVLLPATLRKYAKRRDAGKNENRNPRSTNEVMPCPKNSRALIERLPKSQTPRNTNILRILGNPCRIRSITGIMAIKR